LPASLRSYGTAETISRFDCPSCTLSVDSRSCHFRWPGDGRNRWDGNSFFSIGAGASDSGDNNTNSFFGAYAGHANTTGKSNSFGGIFAGYFNTSGNHNSCFGRSAGYSNTNVNVGIGISAPARRLRVKGDNSVFRMDRSTDTAAFVIVRTNLAGTAVPKTFVVGTDASGSNEGESVINDPGNAVGGPGNRRMTIDNSGDAEVTGSVTATGFYPSSSIALKTNVRMYGNALETVKQLHGMRFDWKASGMPSVGFIAEEVEVVVPEIVAHGGKGGEVTGLNCDSLVGVLVEAVKEQENARKSLKKTAKEQQAELDTLQKEHQAELASSKAEMQELKTLSRGKQGCYGFTPVHT
jgi:hypothetical protein